MDTLYGPFLLGVTQAAQRNLIGASAGDPTICLSPSRARRLVARLRRLHPASSGTTTAAGVRPAAPASSRRC